MSTHLETMNAQALEKRSTPASATSRSDFVQEIASRSVRSHPILRLGPCPRISPSDEREESIER
jgi:hypothetical protein